MMPKWRGLRGLAVPGELAVRAAEHCQPVAQLDGRVLRRDDRVRPRPAAEVHTQVTAQGNILRKTRLTQCTQQHVTNVEDTP